MSSVSADVSGVQSDAVSGGTELEVDGVGFGEEGLEREGGFMEILAEGDSIAVLMDSEERVGEEGGIGLEDEKVSHSVEAGFDKESDLRAVLMDSEVTVDREEGRSVEVESVFHNVEDNSGLPEDNDGFEQEGLERNGGSLAKESELRAVGMEGDESLERERISLNVEGDNDEFEEEGLEKEGDSTGMEIDFVKEGDLGAALVDSEVMVDMKGGSDLEGERGSHNIEANTDSNARVVVGKSDGEKPLNADKSENEVVGSEAQVYMSKESDRVSLDQPGGKDGVNGNKKGKFRASDLVWGKVRSHPWWPGQIFEPGDASEKAKKYSKKPKSYLVAYFGDQSFAWNDRATLKPFAPHFSQMVKQSNMEEFQHAVGCALSEVSRRVEFGLSCSCIADDVYSELETQVIENAGIREWRVLHHGIERSFAISSFEPLEVLDYISNLALGSHTEVDKLEHVMARGKISAFYRWKGIYHLAEFGTLIGYVNNEANAPVPITEEKEEILQVIVNEKDDEGTLQEQHGSKARKRKNISGDNCRQTKKEKCLSDMIPKKGSSKGKGHKQTEAKADRKAMSFSSSSRKKSKVSYNGSKTESISLLSQGTTTPVASNESKPSFSVGESILRVASLLSKPSPLLKLDVLSHEETTTTKGSNKRAPPQTKVGHAKHSSDEIHSLLQLAAREPLKDHTMLTSMVNFFSDFRNSVVADNDVALMHGERPSGSESKCAGITQMCSSQIVSSENSQCVEKTEHEEDSPTSLTLKFTDLDSIPSEAKLNEIFNQFGPLKDSETQILSKKHCARVVFKRRVDADTAFSSSGKFELFGPSLVCYKLNDAPYPSPRKFQRRKDESSVKGSEA